jgi:3-keto-disaccharide hydrolase
LDRRHRATLLALAVLALAAASARAGEWQPLFNGRDLTGWRQVNGSAPYTVVDGAIAGTTVPGSPNSFLATEATYGDFVFECEVLQEGGPSNSGVQFRSASRPEFQDGRVHGYQLEIDPSPRAWTGGVYDEARRGWLYPVDQNPRARTAYQYGRWNLLRIEAIGPSIRTWVNGIPVAHVIDDAEARGFFALQVHGIGDRAEEAGRRILFRNLRIQTADLHPAPLEDIFIRDTVPNGLGDAERAQGWRLLWDGRTTQGWRGAHRKAFPDVGWTIENGELGVQESGGAEARHGGDIVTDEEFSAFELQLEFKLTKGANSGIKYFVTEKIDPGGGSAIGLEFQLLDDEVHPDAKLGAAGNRTLGSLYDLIPRGPMPPGLAVVPRIGEWQHARIVAFPDGRVQHWLNGIEVVEYRRGSPLFAALVARSKYEKMEAFGLAESGHLLLQDHGNQVRFRSIKVRSLARS